MKQAVCAIIYNKYGQILSVSRKDDPEDVGLPGGKVDPGELREQALYREIKEETGLVIDSHLFSFVDYDGDYMVYTYFCHTLGKISTTESGLVQYLDLDEFVNKSKTFKEYNTKLVKYLKEKK